MTADNTIMKSVARVILLAAMTIGSATAAPRDAGGGNAKAAVNKLQTMVKEITTERDALKAENAKVAAELEAVKGQQKQSQDAVTAAATEQKKLAEDLAAQKSTAEEVHQRLDNTTAKLREVVDKYNALNKAKNDLAVAYTALQNAQQATSSDLKACEAKNVKMFEGAKAVMDGYQSCQKRGIVDTLVGSEPFSQVKDVEFENAMQDYEDKLRKQKYQPPKTPSSAPAQAQAPEEQAEPATPAPTGQPAKPAVPTAAQTAKPVGVPNAAKTAPVKPAVQPAPSNK